MAKVSSEMQDALCLIDIDGQRLSSRVLNKVATNISDSALLNMYTDMCIVRRFDEEATALQRQGQLALWPPLHGQEASQIGSARALAPGDFIFSSYREHAVAYARGVDWASLVSVWRGCAASGWDPHELRMATPQVIIGAQALHATGWAMGSTFEESADVAIAYFGDGAMSQGDVNEAMVFAAAYEAPVVFFCQNNHWAISEPVSLQSRIPLANRGPGFGLPSIRVDGNDVLAVFAATKLAVDRARSGGGPTLVEAVTYRMGPHTTADDPKRYRSEEEVAIWAKRDPIDRVRKLLERSGVLSKAASDEVALLAEAAATNLREACLSLGDPEPLTVFDNVYSAHHSGVELQRAEYAAYLEGFAT